MAVSNSRRGIAGIALIISGALFLLAVILPYLNVTFPYVTTLAEIALVVALAFLAVGAVNNNIVKVSLFAAAAGWAVLALSTLGLSIPSGVLQIAAVVAAVGGVVGAIVLYTGKEVRNRPAIVFIVAMALAALFLLSLVGVLSLGQLGLIVAVLFGAALIVAGVLFRQSERSRR